MEGRFGKGWLLFSLLEFVFEEIGLWCWCIKRCSCSFVIWQSTSGWSLRTAMLLSTKGVTPFHFQALPMSLPTHRTWEFALSVIYLGAIMKYIVHLKNTLPDGTHSLASEFTKLKWRSHIFFFPLEVTYKDLRAFKQILIHGFMRLPASSTHLPRCFERSRRLPVAYPKLST